jgi:hypothetical protein
MAEGEWMSFFVLCLCLFDFFVFLCLSFSLSFMLWLPAVIAVPIWLWRHERRRAALTLAATPAILTLLHYLALPTMGRLGVLGIGTTSWFLATISCMMATHVKPSLPDRPISDVLAHGRVGVGPPISFAPIKAT